MPFTGQNFILLPSGLPFLSGTAVVTPPAILTLGPNQAFQAVNAAPPTGSGVASGFANNSATPIDKVICDFALTSVAPSPNAPLLAFGSFIGGFARNGALSIAFAGATPVNIDLTALGTAVGASSIQAGDALFANMNVIVLKNTSSTSIITIAPGASNPSRFPVFTGTTPTLAVGPGGCHVLSDPVGQVVDSTHKTIALTPSAGGSILLAFGGA
jgi:hypothetical protein